MKLVFLAVLILQVTLYCDGVDSFGSHHKGNGHKSMKHHHQMKSKVLMPSGKSYLITTPSVFHKWKCGDRARLVTLHPKNWKKEYMIIKKELENTKGHAISYKHIEIQKVINPCLWKRYKYRKVQVYGEAKKTNERMLFHAAAHPFTVAEKGFDERYTKLAGNYGAGFIFSDNSFKSHSLAKSTKDGKKVMLLCRVSLGNSFSAPAPRQLPHAPVGYQSVSGTDGGFNQYVVYRGEQAYPEYVITYKTA